MTKLRGYIPTMLMLVTLMFGATAANAGIIIADRQSASTAKSDPCTKEESSLTKLAVSVATFFKTGIIIADRTGIIIADRTSSQETCGIIIAD
jgi:hypothetical protein